MTKCPYCNFPKIFPILFVLHRCAGDGGRVVRVCVCVGGGSQFTEKKAPPKPTYKQFLSFDNNLNYLKHSAGRLKFPFVKMEKSHETVHLQL